MATCSSHCRAVRRHVGVHTRSLVNRCASIYGYLGAQYLDRDGNRSACHAQELGAKASDHHGNNGELGWCRDTFFNVTGS
jgi:hypothetical protein